jgi:hypothetical protein
VVRNYRWKTKGIKRKVDRIFRRGWDYHISGVVPFIDYYFSEDRFGVSENFLCCQIHLEPFKNFKLQSGLQPRIMAVTIFEGLISNWASLW